MPRIFKSAIAAFAVAAILAPAALAEPDRPGIERVSVHVRYNEVDLSSPVAGQTLLRRIEYAARRACGSEFSVSLRKARVLDECRRVAVEDAVREAQIDALTLAWNNTRQPETFASR